MALEEENYEVEMSIIYDHADNIMYITDSVVQYDEEGIVENAYNFYDSDSEWWYYWYSIADVNISTGLYDSLEEALLATITTYIVSSTNGGSIEYTLNYEVHGNYLGLQ